MTTKSEHCDMGVGCETAGVCYAEAMGEPARCSIKPIMYTPKLRKVVEEICAAVLADEREDGCDISGGMWGTQFSQVIQRLVRQAEDGERFQALMRAAGDYRSGGSDIVKMFDDDATGTFHITVGGSFAHSDRQSFYACSYRAAADLLIKAYPPDAEDEPSLVPAAPSTPVEEDDDDEI